MKILITTSSFGKGDSRPLDLCRKNCEVILNPYGRKLTTEEFIELSDGVDGVIAGVESITRDALLKRPNIKVISRCGVGMDSVDQEACKELGVKLYNTPNAPVDSVAELTIAVMMDLMKNISNMDKELKSGNWNKMTGFMLKDKKIGIIGMGKIGRRVAELLSAFGVQIAYTDVCDMNNQYTYMDKNELFQWADVISIHASKSEEYIIGEKELEMMKNTAFLVNTSRGKFIDEEALYNSLSSGKLSGAALDVFCEEPYKGKLAELSNVILTPHIASSAKEGRAIMELESVENLFEGLGIVNGESNCI